MAIIGGGASGLVSAIFLARKGVNVTVFEKNSKLGRKITITGNGRCNVTNRDLNIRNFYSSENNQNFIKSVLNRFNLQDTINFFLSIGVELKLYPNGRYYPSSNQAITISDALSYEVERLNIKVNLDFEVKNIEFKNNFFIINNSHKFTKLIIATGSQAMPKIGASGDGYQFAKKFNHSINPLFPSLVQLVSSDKDLHLTKGVKIDGKVSLNNKISFQGDILFTDYGLSGSAILDISRFVSYELLKNNQVNVKVDIFPNNNHKEVQNRFNSLLKFQYNKKVSLFLNGILNKKLALYLIKKLKWENKTTLNQKDIKSLVFKLKNLEFKIIDTKGFNSAEVSGGGIKLSEINQKTLESKKQKNLYFCGEILDVDCACGGYNLQWAFSSGKIISDYI